MIYTIGESVLDIIVKDFDNVRLRPGGSMLNSAISLGRLSVPVSHISCLANDVSSEKLIDFLYENGVNSKYVLRSASKTNIALAYLDAENNADYVFYKNNVEKDVSLSFPEIKRGDIVLYGSFFSLTPAYRKSLIAFLADAKDNGALLIYDPNFRKPHQHQLNFLKPLIEENISFAHIVKASDEDCINIFGLHKGEDVIKLFEQYDTSVLIYTKGSKGAECFMGKSKVSAQALKVTLKSTIGAGDTFSAGIIYSLFNNKVKPLDLAKIDNEKWKGFLQLANRMSASVCESFDNYINLSFNIKNV